MDFDFLWLLLGLPCAFGLGWLASRFDVRQWHKEQNNAPKAYFKGLNLLLNEQHDKAIDAFIEAVQLDPNTTDLHFALGNLFRRRGEFERAVRVHQHLLQRADLPESERHRAQSALAQDFLTAGLFDRAEQAWRSLAGTPFDTEARLALLTLQERSRDWHAALETAQQLERSGIGSYASRIAHYWCELAHAAELQHDAKQATAALNNASQASPLAARPLVMAGHRAKADGELALALQQWGQLAVVQPAAFNLVAKHYAQIAAAAQQSAPAQALLHSLYAHRPTVELLDALDVSDPQGQAQRLLDHLKNHHSLRALRSWINLPHELTGINPSTVAVLETSLSKALQPLQRYRCAACSFETQHYFWQCPGCLSWDSFPAVRVEEL